MGCFAALVSAAAFGSGCGDRAAARSTVALERSEPPAARVIPRFADAAERLGIRFSYDHGGSGRYYYPEIAGAGGALVDFDGDGWLDIYLPQGAPLPGYRGRSTLRNRLYRNLGASGSLGFEDVTRRAGVDGIRDGKKIYCIGCAAGDYDGDGDIDLFVTGFGACLLYRNDSDGRFTEVSRLSGIRDTGFGSSAAFFDYDRDGKLDLVVGEYVRYRLNDVTRCVDPKKQPDYCQPDYFAPARPRLYHNLGSGRFRDVTEAARLTRPGRVLGVVAGDVDDDGWPDIFLTCDKTPNLLYLNQRNGTFREDAVSRGCGLSLTGTRQSGMGVDMRDADGDLRPDLLATNYWMESNNLYRNLGGGVFMDTAPSAGLGGPNMRQVSFGAALQDLNNDGWPDIYVTNGHVILRTEFATPGAKREQTDQLFVNEGSGHFREVSDEAGPWFSTPHVGRGAAFGDVDNDGDLDVLLVPNEGRAALLINDGGNRANWLQLRLEGRGGTHGGIGARVDVTASGRTQRVDARSAYSYCSASDLRVHLGLGSARAASEVVIRWPGGHVDRFPDVAANCSYVAAEGGGIR